MKWIIEFTQSKLGIGVITALASGVLGIAITHMLYRSKLRKEQKVRYENVLGDNIAKALTAVRDLGLECRIQEMVDVIWKLQEPEGSSAVSKIDRKFPELLKSKESLLEYVDKIINVRKENERYLDHKLSAQLYYIERYCIQLIKYIEQHKLEEGFYLVATVFAIDIKDWEKLMEKTVVKCINNPKYKVYKQEGRMHEWERKRINKKLWKKSILRGLIVEDLKKPVVLLTFTMMYEPEKLPEVIDKVLKENKKIRKKLEKNNI